MNEGKEPPLERRVVSVIRSDSESEYEGRLTEVVEPKLNVVSIGAGAANQGAVLANTTEKVYVAHCG